MPGKGGSMDEAEEKLRDAGKDWNELVELKLKLAKATEIVSHLLDGVRFNPWFNPVWIDEAEAFLRAKA